MAKSEFHTGDDKPRIEINKTSKTPFWQSPQFTLIVYLIFILLSFQFWGQYKEAKRIEMPYSEFLQHVEKKEVVKRW